MIYFIPSNLKIFFIDVGQGDSTLLELNNKKTARLELITEKYWMVSLIH